jgi:hypothetical protein
MIEISVSNNNSHNIGSDLSTWRNKSTYVKFISMLHILLAAKTEVDGVLKAVESGEPVRWIVPKKTQAGDRTLLYLPGMGLAAHGVVRSETRVRRQAGYGRYTAMVGEIKLPSSPLSLDFLRQKHPDWKWPFHPQSFTTIEGPIEDRLEKLLKSRSTTTNGSEAITERDRIIAEINQRRGQSKFRTALLNAYGGRCAISGCDA